MFEVTCMVDDKKLPKFMWALDGLIIGQPTVRPIRGAKAKGGRVIGVPVKEQLVKLIYTRNIKQINTPQLKALIEEAGGQAQSISSYVAALRKLKVLAKGKHGAGWNVLAQKE